MPSPHRKSPKSKRPKKKKSPKKKSPEKRNKKTIVRYVSLPSPKRKRSQKKKVKTIFKYVPTPVVQYLPTTSPRVEYVPMPPYKVEVNTGTPTPAPAPVPPAAPVPAALPRQTEHYGECGTTTWGTCANPQHRCQANICVDADDH